MAEPMTGAQSSAIWAEAGLLRLASIARFSAREAAAVPTNEIRPPQTTRPSHKGVPMSRLMILLTPNHPVEISARSITAHASLNSQPGQEPVLSQDKHVNSRVPTPAKHPITPAHAMHHQDPTRNRCHASRQQKKAPRKGGQVCVLVSMVSGIDETYALNAGGRNLVPARSPLSALLST
jgi:hypothetical protein